mmetsp:Transcript_72248/g.233793  ORF Transcript_72248/g.233793 Transcript_72248/m.233793 type:complete len:233 (+) Transcript_72248:151-849(+)
MAAALGPDRSRAIVTPLLADPHAEHSLAASDGCRIPGVPHSRGPCGHGAGGPRVAGKGPCARGGGGIGGGGPPSLAAAAGGARGRIPRLLRPRRGGHGVPHQELPVLAQRRRQPGGMLCRVRRRPGVWRVDLGEARIGRAEQPVFPEEVGAGRGAAEDAEAWLRVWLAQAQAEEARRCCGAPVQAEGQPGASSGRSRARERDLPRRGQCGRTRPGERRQRSVDDSQRAVGIS